MPREEMKGELQVFLDRHANLPKFASRPYLFMSLKRVSYSDEGTVEKQAALTKVCKKFNPNGDEIM